MRPRALPTYRVMERRDFLALLGLGAAGAGIAACTSPASAPAKKRTSSTFPVGAAAKASAKPVEVTMWHSMTSANLRSLTLLTARFNASQRDVHVNLVDQNSYVGTLAAYTKALSSGTLPDLVQMDSSYLQVLIDGRTIVPVQQAIEADGFDMSDFVAATTESFSVAGSLWALPFNCSVQVLYYDKAAFSRAGLDPGTAPSDIGELRTASSTLTGHGASKYGLSLDLTSSSFYQWMALGGQAVVNSGNGHEGRATAVTIDGPGGSILFEWLSEMFASKLAQVVPDGSFDNLLALGNHTAPMTLDSSSSLGSITQVLERGHYKGVDLAVAPTPRAFLTGSGGAAPMSGGLLLVDKSKAHAASPETLDGAWQYLKYMVSTGSQADLAVATGFLPVRRSAAQMPAVVHAWDAMPGYRLAYEQLLKNPGTAVASGPVMGAATSVNDTIQTALKALASGSSSKVELTRATDRSNSALAAYNSHV
jgi:sn-glycerol 3-phosphate transport system substrate-binding protein